MSFQPISINNIDIYPLRISSYYNEVNDLEFFLSEDEIDKANKFYTNKLKSDYIICRGYLRRILGEYIGVLPKNIGFKYNHYGKPLLVEYQNIKNIKFNISHSENYCLIAVTNNNEIGVDIEYIKPLDNYTTIADRFFSAKEASYINDLNDFYTVWAQKEAVIKASGKGVSFGLNHWSTNCKEDKYDITIESIKYRVVTFKIDDNYSSAVCTII